MTHESQFVWYELMTSDSVAAADFYAKVAGWNMADSGMAGIRYTLARIGERQVGGIMDIPEGLEEVRPAWSGYIATADVDGTADKIKQAGGAIHRAPGDIPGVGRFAVVADPQGAAFMLFRGDGEPAPELAFGTPGTVGWHELHASDWEAAYGFYHGLFGWEKGEAFDMGPIGSYQTLNLGGEQHGAMFTNREAPHPFWLYYFLAEDIDAALTRIADHGGAVQHGPTEVPGGMWIIHAKDPQGAMFAMVGRRKG